MRRGFGLPLLLLGLNVGCYPKGRQLCTESPSTRAEMTFEQTCNGVATTWSDVGCSGDDDWYNDADAACRAACKTPPVSCRLVKTAGIGGTCLATTCGSR